MRAKKPDRLTEVEGEASLFAALFLQMPEVEQYING
jgi:hypothetical protein